MVAHAADCQRNIVDRAGRPDECSCGADERATLAERLLEQADNVEGDGWLNAARHMRQAADELAIGTLEGIEAILSGALATEFADGGLDVPYGVIAERVAARVADALAATERRS